VSQILTDRSIRRAPFAPPDAYCSRRFFAAGLLLLLIQEDGAYPAKDSFSSFIPRRAR
jgi:hypothetical protein